MGPRKSEREDYLADAKWAEEMADRFMDGYYKVGWLHIAEGYREMVEQIDVAEAAASVKH